jgi:hypothetical protein
MGGWEEQFASSFSTLSVVLPFYYIMHHFLHHPHHPGLFPEHLPAYHHYPFLLTINVHSLSLFDIIAPMHHSKLQEY